METLKDHFFKDMSILLARSLCYTLRSEDAVVTVAILPIVLMQLFVFVAGCVIIAILEMYSDFSTLSNK